MTDQVATELGRLYRDYYAGRLQFDDYRHRRGLLLDSLSTTHIDVLDDLMTQPRAVESADILAQIDQSIQEANQPVSKPANPPAPATADKPAFSGRVLGLLAAVAVFALVVFVSLRLIQPADESQAQVKPAVRGVITTAPPPLATTQDGLIQPSGVGQPLVEDFLENNDWSDGSISAFQSSWASYSAPDRNLAKESSWFQPLLEGLRERINEARAAAIDPDNDEQLGKLYLFALGLGLVDLVPAGWTPPTVAPARQLAEKAPASKSKTDSAGAGSPPTLMTKAESTAATPAKPVVAAPAEVIPSDQAPAVSESATSVARPVSDYPCTADLLKTRKRTCFDMIADGQRGPLLKVLPAGEFQMGNDDYPDEKPAHPASVAKPIALAMYETSQAEYAEFCEAVGATCPESPWQDKDMPVVNVSWVDANKYAQWLSKVTGQKYRLPTEVEWEFAARAGKTTLYPNGDEMSAVQARYSYADPLDSPLPSTDKTTQRNGWDIWHIVGNVREWVNGDWTGQGSGGSGADARKVARGGSYASPEGELRSSARQGLPATTRDTMTGFRVLREL